MSDCSCIYVGDYDPAEVYVQKTLKARKTHQCGECGRDILSKEHYERTWGIWDGMHNTYKTCADCLSARKEFFCEGWIHGEIWCNIGEHISEIRGELSGDCLVALTPAARARVCEIIEDCWEDLDDDDECEA
jgi:hypothetical protein